MVNSPSIIMFSTSYSFWKGFTTGILSSLLLAGIITFCYKRINNTQKSVEKYHMKTWINDESRFYLVPNVPLKWCTNSSNVEMSYSQDKIFKQFKIPEDYTMTFEFNSL
jgi:hypothetical protein